MKQTFKQFNESTELNTIHVRPLKSVELHRAKEAVQAALLGHQLAKEKKPTLDQIKAVHDQLAKFKLPFVQAIVKELDEVFEKYRAMMNAGTKLFSHGAAVGSLNKAMKAAFLSGDKAKFKELKAQADSKIADLDHHVDAEATAHRKVKNSFTAEASIFGTTRLLSTVGDHEYDKLKALDFSQPLYTGLDFPTKQAHDFHYVLYFLTNLTNSPKPIRMTSANEFRTHTRVKYANDGKLEKLLKITDDYLHSNDKTLIPQIMALVNDIPSIKSANDSAKKKIKTVYRGIGIGEDDEGDPSRDQIIAQDRESKYVATSDSRHAAKNFALQKGHLEDSEERRSALGYIIEYRVTPDAILFDTKVIDTVYNESEILIDATKAEVVEIKEV